MNSGIKTKFKPNAERAQRFLHEVFKMGKPDVEMLSDERLKEILPVVGLGTSGRGRR